MLHHQIAKRRCKYSSWLWFVNHEAVIRLRSVSARLNFLMDSLKIRSKVAIEVETCPGSSFVSASIQVSMEEIFPTKCPLKKIANTFQEKFAI